jgi:hypothetical protein
VSTPAQRTTPARVTRIFFCHAQPGRAFCFSMIDFFQAGGYTMFVVLVVGAVMVIAAARFARAANPQGLALVRALTWALVFAAISGIAANLMTVCHAVNDNPEWAKTPLPILLEGFAESITPAILGGAIASIAWILVAVGVRRMPAA